MRMHIQVYVWYKYIIIIMIIAIIIISIIMAIIMIIIVINITIVIATHSPQVSPNVGWLATLDWLTCGWCVPAQSKAAPSQPPITINMAASLARREHINTYVGWLMTGACHFPQAPQVSPPSQPQRGWLSWLATPCRIDSWQALIATLRTYVRTPIMTIASWFPSSSSSSSSSLPLRTYVS